MIRYSTFFIAIIFFFISCSIWGQTAIQPSGSGTSDDPYQISTLENLYWVTQNSSSWSSFFIQTADIDASATMEWDGGRGFTPLGNEVVKFNGVYNGQEHSISYLFINRPNKDYIGFVGWFEGGGVIKNLTLFDNTIIGNNYVGGIVGNTYENLFNCTFDGSVRGNLYIGGLIGVIMEGGIIVNRCNSNGIVTGDSYVGGLVGYNNGTAMSISNSYSRANVSGTNDFVGGLVGKCYSGGIFNSYSMGDVQGQSLIGGLIGDNFNGSIENCYSTGAVSGNSILGGLIGNNYVGYVIDCFWDTESSSIATSEGGVGKITAEMKILSTFTTAGWDFVYTWEIIGFNYPRLKNNPDSLLPVELTAFNANYTKNTIFLNWQTATEVNNYGFEVERNYINLNNPNSTKTNIPGMNWEKIGFVEGNGNSNSPKEYSFIDENPREGINKYRLKQVDIDGRFEYSEIVEVDFQGEVPANYSLSQNYPNPFNPTTKIQYQIPIGGFVTLKIYNILGGEVGTLVNEYKSAGSYEVEFSVGSFPNLSSGVYFYKLSAGIYSAVKKLMLIK